MGLEGATPGATPAPAELLSAPKSEGEFPDLPWGTPVVADKVRDYLTNAMQERVLVLDGAMGTTIQQYKFTEADFRRACHARSQLHTGHSCSAPAALAKSAARRL